MMKYRCLRHVQYIVGSNTDEYMTRASSILKGNGETVERAYDIMATSAATSGYANTVELMNGIVADREEGGAFSTAPKWHCNNMAKYLAEHNCVCACADCPAYKPNRGKEMDFELDLAVMQWCLVDGRFMTELKTNGERVSRAIKKGLLCSPVVLLDSTEYGYAYPLYANLYQIISESPFQIVYMEKRDSYTGIYQTELENHLKLIRHRIESELYSAGIPENYHAMVFEQLEYESNRLVDLSALRDRAETLSSVMERIKPPVTTAGRTANVPAAPKTEKGGAGEKTSQPVPTIMVSKPEVSTPVHTEKAKADEKPKVSALQKRKAQMKEKERQGKTAEKDTSKKPKSEAEDEFAGTSFPFRKEQSYTIYPCNDLDSLDAVHLTTEIDFDNLFYMLVESRYVRLPMEIIRDTNDSLYALMYVKVPNSRKGAYYLVPEYSFDCLAKSRVFSKAKPLCFQPFAILSMFPSLRKIYSLSLLWNTFYRKEYIPAAEGLLYDQGVCNDKNIPTILFLLRNYQDVYEHLYAIYDEKTKKLYRERICQSVYRSTSYLMREVYSIAESREDTLFTFTGREYRMNYPLHSLVAKAGYTKYRIIIKDLPVGILADMVTVLSVNYCEQSFFRELDIHFLGTVETRNELSFVVNNSCIPEFLESMRLEMIRITDRLLQGKADIIIQEEILNGTKH